MIFYYNDFLDVLAEERYGYPKSRFVFLNDILVLENVPVPKLLLQKLYDPSNLTYEKLEVGILNHLHIFNLVTQKGPRGFEALKEKLSQIKTRVLGQNSFQKEVNNTDIPEPNHKINAALLKKIHVLCKRNNMTFDVIFLITKNTNQYWNHEMIKFAEILSAENIKHSFFYSQHLPNTDLWLDGHLSSYGNELLANHVLEVLQVK